MAVQGILQRCASFSKKKTIISGYGREIQKSESADPWFSEPLVSVPSWLWASVNAPIQYRLWHFFWRNRDRDVEVLAPPCTIVEGISVKCSAARALAKLGSLTTIEAVKIRELPGCKLMFDPRPWGWYSSAPLVPEIIRDMNDTRTRKTDYLQNLVIMKILDGGYADDQMAQYCLVLQPCPHPLPPLPTPMLLLNRFSPKPLPPPPGIYRRLGLLIVDKTLNKLCVNDPEVCRDNRCLLEKMETRNNELISWRCLGRTTTVTIV
ncbi:hypothetical protein QBC36DRAFT_350712 [Triangularia setosa]|uniref:Uncharacterized protein n=1 Tax=Triangularia setosa TaxID=2587417 RepID=A0AAN7A1U2_9PEZI|nr:hypothetical protein QBC36DRAFT_350712 [Podospora setosa]